MSEIVNISEHADFVDGPIPPRLDEDYVSRLDEMVRSFRIALAKATDLSQQAGINLLLAETIAGHGEALRAAQLQIEALEATVDRLEMRLNRLEGPTSFRDPRETESG